MSRTAKDSPYFVEVNRAPKTVRGEHNCVRLGLPCDLGDTVNTRWPFPVCEYKYEPLVPFAYPPSKPARREFPWKRERRLARMKLGHLASAAVEDGTELDFEQSRRPGRSRRYLSDRYPRDRAAHS